MPDSSSPPLFRGPIELRADGTVTNPFGPFGKMASGRFVEDNGGVIFAVAFDGSISGDGALAPLKFDGDDLVVGGPPGTRVSIADNGTIAVSRQLDHPYGHFEGGVPAGGKRAAALLVAMLMVHGLGFRHAKPAAIAP